METTTRLILPEVAEALASNPEQVAELAAELHPADLADLAVELDPELAQRLLSVLPVDTAARLLEMCGENERSRLFATLATNAMERAAAITDMMAPDDRADMYATLGEEMRAELLSAVDEEERRDIRQLLAYEEDSAGALLTTEFVALPADATVSEAIELVRHTAAEVETIYSAYAVDPTEKLLGVVSLRDLVTSPANRTIREIMNPNVVTVDVDMEQEEVARVIAKYDLLAVPVVDRSHRVLGIITVDDVLDVVEEEATEDVQKLGAVEPLEESYLATPLSELIRKRAPWLVVLFVAGLATRNVLEIYTLAVPAAVFLFVPLIASAGGNSGTQSAALIIRALAVGRLELRDAGRVLGRELAVGLVLGCALSVVGMASAVAFDSTRAVEMVLTLGVAVIAVVTLGALLGSGIPLLLERLGIDPAVSSTPFIASMCDIAGLFVYFQLARLFFG
jgi:magnesium transporter